MKDEHSKTYLIFCLFWYYTKSEDEVLTLFVLQILQLQVLLKFNNIYNHVYDDTSNIKDTYLQQPSFVEGIYVQLTLTLLASLIWTQQQKQKQIFPWVLMRF